MTPRDGKRSLVRLLDLGDRLLGGVGEDRAEPEIWDAGDLAAVLAAPRAVDVIVSHKLFSV